VATFDLDLHPDAPRRVREYLEANRIESRPIWKPMHQQPVFRDNFSFLNGNADALFDSGLCLPSGPNMTQSDVERVSGLLADSLGI
jgi:dTDP-4-amino-4,6-dideoxygalactose transaminase